VRDVAEGDAPQERGDEGGPEDRGLPVALPVLLGPLDAVLEGDSADDQADQDDQQRQV